MTAILSLVRRFLALFRRERLDREMDDELRFHLEMETERNLGLGMTPEEARRAARKSFGGLEQVREAYRDRRGLPAVDSVVQDLRYAGRMLRRAPGFTAVAVVSLALALGANVAVFSLVDAVLVRPLPYADPGGLVRLWESFQSPGGRWTGSVSVANLEDWKEQNTVFTGLAAYSMQGFTLSGGGEPVWVEGARVGDGAFDLLGVTPLFGGGLYAGGSGSKTGGVGGAEAADEGRVVLGYDLWQRSFGGDRSIVGREVSLSGVPRTVVGVMPAGFRFPPGSEAEVWVPLVFTPQQRESRGSHWLSVFGRLAPGASVEKADTELDALAHRIAAANVSTNNEEDRGAQVRSLHDSVVSGTRPTLLVLWAVVGLVLVISCANVSNLLLSRAEARRTELAVRAAIGAGRGRLARQLLTETLLLAAAGGALGLGLGAAALARLPRLPGLGLPRGVEAAVDGRVVAFSIGAVIVCALLSGLIPAFRSSATGLDDALKAGGRGTARGGGGGGGRGRDRVRAGLVVAEIALALAVVVGAGLMFASFRSLSRVETGFPTDRLLTLRLPLSAARYDSGTAVAAFQKRLLERLGAIPGVESVGLGSRLPLKSWGYNGSFGIEGRVTESADDRPFAEFRTVSDDYFQTLGIPLLAGRAFQPGDGEKGRYVVMINRSLAERYWPGESPLGRRLTDLDAEPFTIVGVVGDVKNAGLANDVRSEMYFPIAAWPQLEMDLVARTAGEPTAMGETFRRAILELDPAQAIYDLRTMDDIVAGSLAGRRVNAVLLGAFALLAVALAMAGVFGVVSYDVARRTHELGLRMALGARVADVLTLVVRDGLVLAGGGVVLGLGAAWALGRLLQGQLFAVGATDAATYAAAAGLLLAVTLAACWLPARRAARIDPMRALRID